MQEQSQAQSNSQSEEISPLVQAAIDLVSETGPTEDLSAAEQLAAADLPERVEEKAAELDASKETAEEQPQQEAVEEQVKGEDKWSLLAKSERKARELASKTKEYEKQIEELRRKAELAEIMSKDPVAFARNNLTAEDFEKIADDIISGKPLNPKPSKEQSELEQLKAQLDELKQEKLTESQQKVIENYKHGISKSIQDTGGLVAHWPGIEDEVLQFADAYATRFGEVLTPEEATSRIADALTESLRSVHEANPQLLPELLGIRSEQPRQQPRAESKTLTNKLSASVAPDSSEEMSEAERIKLATLAFQGKLDG